MESKLLARTQTESLSIIDLYPVTDRNNEKVAFFETNEGTGIALLHKGFNDKYLVTDMHQTTKVIDGVSFIIGGRDFTIFYGKGDQSVAHMKYLPGGSSYEINNQYIYHSDHMKKYDGPVGLIYTNQSDENYHAYEVTSEQGNMWRNFVIPFRSILYIVLSILLTRYLRKDHNNYNFDEYNRLPKDGQRVKQDWFRI